MYKLVSPRELTEIITGLLLKPELLGELDSPEKHRMFMADLGRVVAEHCGGLVNVQRRRSRGSPGRARAGPRGPRPWSSRRSRASRAWGA
ncbi:hypothetical protein F1331_26105 [Salmonella enterica subsp. enterica serovar Dessau]|uniref:Uncharacterized protein n=1 Tax=Salmonella enterica subsp. enterica serovar Dessau TaxID=2564349 RepID=A0A8E5MYK9_SALET|nr:hypothetical protein F1331_26105 [Salmonella enterica subsp. enterica serovar Dessau]